MFFSSTHRVARSLVGTAGLAFLFLVGCGPSTPTGPTLTEEQRKEKIKQDIENLQRERKGGPAPSR